MKRQNEFSRAVIDKVARNAMYICENPQCLRLTGYTTTEGWPRTIAQAAHVFAASQRGPRAAKSIGDVALDSPENGIWLCSICHKKVDDDPTHYSSDVLFKWKKDHEQTIREIVGKDLERALLDLRNGRRHHAECREFLSFLESRRLLYEGLDHEFPPRVRESLDIIRIRISETRAKVAPQSDLATALNNIQKAIDQFLREIGKETDLNVLRCDGTDLRWKKFSEELLRLRTGIIIIMKVLAGDAGYNLVWV